jgi:hypothetical protein
VKDEFSEQNVEKRSNIKFHQNPSTGSRVVPCGRSDEWTDGQTDILKITVSFRNFANVPKMGKGKLFFPVQIIYDNK